MKKMLIIGGVIILLLVGGVVVFGQKKDGTTSSTTHTANSSQNNSAKKAAKACDLITLEDAKSLIGTNATLLDGSRNSNPATTDSVSVDNCSYSAEGATIGDTSQLTLQVQSGPAAQIKQAYANYQKQYPGEALAGLGDKAYYSDANDQVVVLKGSHWFFVGGGSINSSKDAKKALDLKAATIALSHL